MKRFVAMALAGLTLAACGSITASSAMISWVTQSNFATNSKVLFGDARHSANALRKPSISNADLHTVCAVLLVDVAAANSSLPTPDAQATKLLSRAYTDLGAGANRCYNAAHDLSARGAALVSLATGAAVMSEASVRVATASLP